MSLLNPCPTTALRFEIRIDGTPRSYCDRKDFAMEAARLIKGKNPRSMVEVKDLQSGDVTAVGSQAGLSYSRMCKAGRGRSRVTGYDAFTAGNDTGTNRDELVVASLAARAAASSRRI
jgi:hypothetical protein